MSLWIRVNLVVFASIVDDVTRAGNLHHGPYTYSIE